MPDIRCTMATGPPFVNKDGGNVLVLRRSDFGGSVGVEITKKTPR